MPSNVAPTTLSTMRGEGNSPLQGLPMTDAAALSSRSCMAQPGPSSGWQTTSTPPRLAWEHPPHNCARLPSVSDVLHAPDIPLGLCTFTAENDNAAAQPRQARVQPIPLPAQVTGVIAVTLHSALRMGAKSLHTLDFAMPLAVDSEVVRAYGEPATFPGLPSLTITSPRLPWAMTAHATASVSRACVTVGDVVRTIHGALGIRVTEGEVEEWMVDRARDGPGSFVVQVDSFKTRRTGEKRKRTYERGMTRLAFLEGRTRFCGLSESAMGCDVVVVEFI